MDIFTKLVDSYRSKNYTEFEELCKSSLTMDIDSFILLHDLLDNVPDVEEAYYLVMENHTEWGEG